MNAVLNVNTVLKSAIRGQDALDQRHIDNTMLELDGTENKSNLGANALLAVSLASAHAAANAQGIPLYQHLGALYGNPQVYFAGAANEYY